MVKRHVVSFANAFVGIKYAVTTQPNFVIHFILSLCAVILGVVTNLSLTEWSILCIVIGVGLAIEMINTAIEAVVDLATNLWHKDAKVAKDTAAAAMLIYAIFSILFAMFLFLPKLVSLGL